LRYHRLCPGLPLCHPTRSQSPLRLLQRLQSYHRQRRCAKPQSTDPAKANKKRGQARFGYRTIPLQLPDPIRRFSLVLLDDFLPASDREENPATALLLQLPIFYPDLEIDAVAGDAGLGYDIFLHTVYAKLHARRVVDLRAHSTDQDKTLWPLRGYDDKGRPICVCAYRTTSAMLSKPTASTSTDDVTNGPASTTAAARPLPSLPSVGLPIRLMSALTRSSLWSAHQRGRAL
jgi:hypothetical protein